MNRAPRATIVSSSFALMLVGVAAAPAVARPTFVVNRFDTAAEINDWRFDFGGVGQVKSFSTDNASGGGPGSGSMEVALTFPAPNGDHKGAYTNDEFFPGQNLADHVLDFDVKVVPGSAPDAFGNNGFFSFALRNTDNYNYNQVFGDNVRVDAGWRHVQVAPLTGAIDAVRALTFQLYGGPDQNINGTVTLRIDNVVISPIPEPATLGAALALGATALLRRQRRASC
jgi:hypothetical protein